ncbi:ATP-binding protein [Spirulina subsalsa FACHB-351]|uniref:ATP-binding protein n=1 Tax=Spirulina subsalsa FACHB-351 TaxID=234711 RepID=A0ABT3LAT4_9CYAN|nr:ATP-binding protein [Spirulina subsalsa]MCW6038095.1 ATP-binding protein [Spirulina subsalsa FACHB-351]
MLGHEINRSYLGDRLSRIRQLLERRIHKVVAPIPSNPSKGRKLSPLPYGKSAIVARLHFNLHLATYLLKLTLAEFTNLEQVCHLFGLDSFERDLLLLCAGIELESTWSPLCAAAQGDAQRNYPTFSLALATLPNPNWQALTPEAPLRRWRLIHVEKGQALTSSPLRIDERILHHLLGLPYLDEPLMGLVQPLTEAGMLVPSQQTLAQRLLEIWGGIGDKFGRSQLAQSQRYPVIQLCGEDRAGKQAIATQTCHHLNVNPYLLPAPLLPTAPQDLAQLTRLWEREALLSSSVLILDCEDSNPNESSRENAITYLIEHLKSPLMVLSRDRRPPHSRPLLTFEVHRPTSSEQRTLWQEALGPLAHTLDGHVNSLVSQFNLNAPTIRAASSSAVGQLQNTQPDPQTIKNLLWQTCRSQARPRLEDLAQRITSNSLWDDLVLPETQKDVLREIAAHVRQRAKVYEEWGFGGNGGRGLGITALFAGASGTGKTMAADILASELQLDLYRIDLSSVISKYIGETEKNLRRVFDAAETGGAILLFDEADALFGKRSEVKDSHDRHANIEVSYLLQRMEAYRGLAILTTNLKDALDQAFLRRIRFTVKFPFPDSDQRAEIWRRVFPQNTPTEGLNPEKLCRLSVAGGNIRNIALNAAFLAADAGEPVKMQHILTATKSEYSKLEKPLTDVEIKGWV